MREIAAGSCVSSLKKATAGIRRAGIAICIVKQSLPCTWLNAFIKERKMSCLRPAQAMPQIAVEAKKRSNSSRNSSEILRGWLR
jgi:hypothetical protein